MTCPDPANNCACVSLYNGECILPEVRRYCSLRRKTVVLSALAVWYLTASAAPFHLSTYYPARPPESVPYTIPGVPAEYQACILRAAVRHGVPPPILAGIARAESDFTPGAVSPDGHDRGMFQLRDLYDAQRGVVDPFDPEEAAVHAARILRDGYEYFGDWERAVAAYRQGVGGVLEHGVGWWYVRRVMDF